MRSRERSAVWFHRYPGSGTSEAGLLAELARQGLECHPLPRSSEPSHGPGLVLFDAFTPDLADWIRERSGRGEERLLAVGTREALSRGAGWRLLAAGAADVLPWPDLPGAAETIAARFARWEEVDRLVGSAVVTKNLVGRSLAWRSALRQIVEVARFSGSSVLLRRRERHRQGAGRPADPHARRPRGEARSGDPRLHDDRAGALRQRVLRPRAGRLHRRRRRPRRGLRAGRRRHAVPRRGRRAAAPPPGRAAAGGAGGHLQARGEQHLAEDALPAGLRDPPGPPRRARGGAVPRRLLLPHRRLDLPPAAAARAPGGHPSPGRATSSASASAEEAPELDAAVADLLLGRDYPGNVRDLRQLVAPHRSPPRRQRARSRSATCRRRSGRGRGRDDGSMATASRRDASTRRARGLEPEGDRRLAPTRPCASPRRRAATSRAADGSASPTAPCRCAARRGATRRRRNLEPRTAPPPRDRGPRASRPVAALQAVRRGQPRGRTLRTPLSAQDVAAQEPVLSSRGGEAQRPHLGELDAGVEPGAVRAEEDLARAGPPHRLLQESKRRTPEVSV